MIIILIEYKVGEEMNDVLLDEDIKEILKCDFVDYSILKNKYIFITGSTGLICSMIVKALINIDCNLILLVRDIKKAKEMFGNANKIQYIEGNVETYKPFYMKIDYVIHGASPTKSAFFVRNPVETLDVSILGTRNILEQARISQVKSFVYLSSMEMYGVLDSNNVSEAQVGYINLMDVRSSYSEGKRVCELYCVAFSNEYNLPVKIARIAQTFGTGISLNETRVYKYFCDCIINKKNIVLNSSGKTKVNFSYITDTVLGVLKIMLNGENSEAYNIVSDSLNYDIKSIAEWLIKKYAFGEISLIINDNEDRKMYAPENQMVLSNEKLKKLGWIPKYNVEQGYERLIEYLK